MLRSIGLAQREHEKGAVVILENSQGYLGGIFSDNVSANSYASINVLGRPLVIYNLEKLATSYGSLNRVVLPAGLSEVEDLITNHFPSIHVEESNPRVPEKDAIRIPLNSIIIDSRDGECAFSPLIYPWDILKATQYILGNDLKSKIISKDVSIESGSIIDGPCLIESGVTIDNFCKIKGPAYIGPNCKIGTGSLVRNSMLGENCTIGFSCEVARSYVSSNDTFPHYDAILDSVVGEHTWMGGYVAITNVMLNNKEVRYMIDGKLVETGLFHFGAIIGHHSTIGASVVILPGRYLPPHSFVPPHIVYSSWESKDPATP
jgi:UDP-N-acetylglucosamine diphosphorylase / glucose-1-phosphate thymidylyltransferase / UDP-N-acetylgalactosamine diphosphorylase / glucosamine-1-phosphate N-acetyltransferase / galactosamine-1-phosphate N-acetyltransferase